ncbi:LOW QUALITY PROTEIN: aerobic glycerol-3-phosphate dehydrogenase [Bacillus sp. JCM 19046]|nr:LOW QUALITY PROTEIN: aerobic glycerol-3-phosphate dehydrogenase [Bacillus sp. JCM 19046]
MVHSFSNEDRGAYINSLKETELDVLIIGGGVTGAGIALDAVVRGLKTGLVDMQDFASGSSSYWASLFHNEMRQGSQLDMKWHTESIKERLILQENAPHLMRQTPLILPSYRTNFFGKHSISSKMIERISDMALREKRKSISRKELLKLAPALSKKQKVAAVSTEYCRDETRLTFDLLKEGRHRGLIALNYLKVESFLYENGMATGVLMIDQLTGEMHKVFAKKIVNASGAWVDSLREQDRSKTTKTISYLTDRFMTISKEKIPFQHIVYLEMDQRRLLSIIPRDKNVIISLTSTEIVEKVTWIEIIEMLNQLLEEINLTEKDIETKWLLHRPIVLEQYKNKKGIVKRNDWFVSESGLLTVVCGQHTRYRLFAEQITSWICKELKVVANCETDMLTLSGGYVGGQNDFSAYRNKRAEEGLQFDLTRLEAERLVDRYGSNVGQLYARTWAFKKQATLFGLNKSVFAELLYSIEEEMATSPADFLIRRTGYFYFDNDYVMTIKEPIFRYMRDRFNWTEEQEGRYRDELEGEIELVYRRTDLD